jgi:hypothetical protein
VPPAIEHDPHATPDFTWVVARLQAGGALDPGFGRDGIASLPGRNGTGNAAAVLPDGSIAALGRGDGGARLARLTPDGGLDPAFNGGRPVEPPGARPFWFGLHGRPDGGVDVLERG